MAQMCSKYSCKRATRRWPLAMFYNLVDIAALATYIIYAENQSNIMPSNLTRRRFLVQLSLDLCHNNILRRSQNQHVIGKPNLRSAICDMLGYELPLTAQYEPEISQLNESSRTKIQGKCHICASQDKRQRNSRKRCTKCEKPVCNQHTKRGETCQAC
ncbi:uncharacterized protein LOC118749576 [Rhagoletis pomonella]|uniref:uncharacterized protein LOC118749576 n=1 Tax=Rhagoletis pomonella TaxID=28610 RepID=UPI001785B456|nr:uncharacterized protein LOC118749576 [Rhagoletis pomonella]